MHVKTAEMRKATAATAMARTQNHEREAYANQDCQSRANLTRAADVLLLLALCPVSETTQLGLFALLDRRLRRAYEGVTR